MVVSKEVGGAKRLSNNGGKRHREKKEKIEAKLHIKAVEKPKTIRGPRVDFPIVGIGASAGGVAAFEAFFSGIPEDNNLGIAFVVLQHLAPNHESILCKLIGRSTGLPVIEIEDGMAVKPNHVYVAPPNRDIAYLNGRLQLFERNLPRNYRLPIDFFFNSLAQDLRDKAIGIVLSGTGRDGTLGARAIKSEGGMVMVQNPASTEYDGMPRSAIATGLVDFELPPAEMPAQLIDYTAQAFGTTPNAITIPDSKVESTLRKVFVLLRAQTGHDFSQYKSNTVIRRIERRMTVHQIETLDGYVRYLQSTPAEVETLFRDLLIRVTQFFRDPEAFATFEELVVPRLLDGKSGNTPIRVWVPGCCSGEEAYSIAILLQERMEALKQNFKIQIFASDIDNRTIDIARSGVYPASIADDVTPERLARFFIKKPNGAYRIHKSIRELLVFSVQDVIKDPPFSKLDLISCRNLLIYMDGELQKKVIPMFHYALDPGGFLFLGASETVGEFTDFFTTTDRKAKLYQRKEYIRGKKNILLPITERGAVHQTETVRKKPNEDTVSFCALAEQALLQQYAPTAALVNEQGNILHFFGNTEIYFKPAPKGGDKNILKMARRGLPRALGTALRKAVANKEVVRHKGLQVKTNQGVATVTLTIQPVTVGQDEDNLPALFLVVLEKSADKDKEQSKKADVDADARIAGLVKELRTKEEHLRAINKELATSNENLQSSSEELRSINEELHSANEELETSKEELQSINEELATVNAELQINVAELSEANNDMNNLLAGTGVGTVFVDQEMRIRRYTPTATRFINLIPSDVGRPLGHIVVNLAGYDSLTQDVQSVLDNLTVNEIEVQTKTGDWCLLRVLPYRTIENAVEGAVITFVDITEMKRAEEKSLKEGNMARRLAMVARDSIDAITAQDLQGQILAWNAGAEKLYGWNEDEALSMNIRDLIPENLHKEALARIRHMGLSETIEPHYTQRLTKDGRSLQVWMTATALLNEAGEVYAIATTERARRSG